MGQLADNAVSELFVLLLVVPLSIVMVVAVWRRYRIDLHLRPHDPPRTVTESDGADSAGVTESDDAPPGLTP